MKIALINLNIYLRSKNSIQLFIFLAVCGILNSQVSTLKAEELSAHPRAIVFNAVQGHSLSETRSIFIFTALGTTINWSQSKDVSWLTTNLINGVTEGILEVGVNTTGLQPGIYYGNITIVSPQSSAGPIIVKVTLVINPDVPVNITTWKDGHAGAMSVSVDDGQPSGFDELQSNGFSGTYVYIGTIPPSFYTDYYNAGMELGSHTVNHNCADVSDDALRSQELEPNILGICTNTPEPCTDVITFAWPCGYTNYHEQAVATEYFLSARGYNINQLEDATPVNFMNLKSYNSHEHTPYPPSDLKTVVDAAVNQQKWFNLVLHTMNNDDGAISYAHSKDIWVTSIGTVIKYILQRDRFILTNYNVSTDRITYNVSRLQISSSVYRSFENAFGPNDQITMQIDVDDSKTVENVFIDGVSNPYQIKDLNGNKVLLTNLSLASSLTKTVEVKYHVTTVGLTITGVTANNKVYDGTTAATLNTGSASLVGIIGGDIVTLVSTGATGTFANKNVGTGKTISTSGFALGGSDAGKYTLTQPITTANITKAGLTISGVTANNKVYNRTTTATLNIGSATFLGVFGTDVVTLNSTGATGTFADKNVGTGKAVSISDFTLGGADAGNYSLAQPSSTANITTAGLTISGVTANNKAYDGTTAATLNTGSATLVGVIGGDVVSLISTGAIGNFANGNVGTGKVVTTSGFELGGTDSGNYSLTQPTTTADITGIALTVTGVTANNKIYDGTTTATLNAGSAVLVGVLSGDVVSLISTGATGVFVNKNVGSGKTVSTSGFTLGGADAGKYSLTQPTAVANITTSGLTVSGVTANNKVYNGTTAANLNTGSAVLVGVVPGDVVTLVSTGATGTFADQYVGAGKGVSISGFTLGGTNAGNYTLTQPSSTGNITAAGLTVSGVTANNKIYDGTTAATLNTGNATLVGVFGGDVVTLISTGATGTFTSKSAGTAKVITTSGFALVGSDVSNYTLAQPTTTGNIIGIILTVTGITANNKVYNGTTTATLNTGGAALSGVIGGDVVNLVSIGATGTFINKNVGTGKSVTTSGFTLGGTDAGNYTLTQPSSAANITTAGLTVSGVTANKVYDETTAAILNTGGASLVGVFGADVVTLVSTGATGTFLNKNVGSGKSVSTSGFTLGGTDAGNYTITQPGLTSNIIPAGLTVSGVTANNKVYDGTAAVTLNAGSATLVGVFGTDAVTLVSTDARGTFANKNVVSGKVISTSGFTLSGIDAGNYTLTQPSTTANITAAGLTISGVTANNKVYNGTTTATLNTGSAVLSGVIGGDVVTLVPTGATGTFANKNVGTGKSVSTSGFTLGGTDAGNYTITQPSSVANITTAGLTVSGVTANNKVYDGTTAASLNTGSAALVSVFGTDAVTLVSTGATGTFADRNVGSGKVVSTSGFNLGGTDSGNYTLTQPSLIADLLPKAVTITANDFIKHFNTILTFTGNEFTAEGLIPGDAVPSVIISSPGAPASADVGKYVISIAGGADDNYQFSYVNGTLTVGKSTLIVMADNKTKVYGSENSELSITYSGFFKNEDASVLDVNPVVTTTALNTSNAGSYAITLSGGSDNNYDLTLVNGSLEIVKAPLTITAEDKTKVYGEVNSDLTITYSGFVLGQDQSVLDVLPVAETDANLDSDAGNYDINITGAADKNYSFIYNKGTLNIKKADQVITFSEIPAGLRMTQRYNLSATASSGLNVSFEVSDPSIASLNGNILTVKKDGNLTITAKQEGDQNWNPAPDITHSIETLPTFDDISSLFTPNNDGMNDYWYIPDLEQYGKLQVTVYNRFGQAVYQSDSYKNDWDGTCKGYPLPSASYYYIIKSSTKGFIKGVVNIVR